MALNKVKIKNTESIRLVTGDKTEISGGSSFNGIEIVGVTNGIADAGDVTLLPLAETSMFLGQVLQVNLYSMQIIVKFLYML